MIGTTCSPSFTARLPPGRKHFWTSTTMSTLRSSGEILVAAKTELIRPPGVPARPTPQSPNTNRRRSMPVMIASLLHSGCRKVQRHVGPEQVGGCRGAQHAQVEASIRFVILAGFGDRRCGV